MTATPDKFHIAKIIDRRAIADDLLPPLHRCRWRRHSHSKPVNTPHSASKSPTNASSARTPSSLSPTKIFSNSSSNTFPTVNSLLTSTASPKTPQLLLRKMAKGRFTLDLPSGRKNHLLLSTVTGVAPYVSYIRTIYTADWKKGGTPMPGEHKLFCIHGSSRVLTNSVIVMNLEKIANEAPWLKYVPVDQPSYGRTLLGAASADAWTN